MKNKTEKYESVYGPLSLEKDESYVKKPKDSIFLYLSAIGGKYLRIE